MLIGHYAPAFLLQRWQPRVSLAVLFGAVQAVDIGWSSLVLLGVEQARLSPGWTASNDLELLQMPYTHSLLAAGIWALGAGLLWWRLRPQTGGQAAVAVALAVGSHWFLDLPVHKGDLSLAGESARFGFGLWQNKALAFGLELGLFVGAWAIWALPTPSRRQIALLLVGSLLTLYCYFGPPPATLNQLCLSTLVLYVGMVRLADRWGPQAS